MGTSGSAPDVTQEDTRSVFSQLDEPFTPLTAGDVAAKLECTERTARHSLEELVELGELQTRQIGDQRQVWWQSGDGTESDRQQSELEEFGAFVSAVEDYAIFMLDPDGNVASWNEGAERIKGYAEDEIVGEHVSTFYTDADIDEGVPERNLETAVAENRVEDEGWRVREDGSRFWANVVITAIWDDDGTLQGFTKVTRDMTERREYEQRLRQERDITKQILETVPVSIYTITPDGKLLRANQRALERIDSEESDLPEYTVESWDLYDAEGEPIPADEWPWKQVIETGEPVYDYQCQVDLPDIGRRWLSINAAPIEKDEHDSGRIVFSVDDITDQKERERQLRRESDQTKQLLRTAPVAIAVQNTDGETVMANQRAQEALGLSEQEIIEEGDDADEWEIYDANGDRLAPTETPSARVLATGEPVLDEELVVDPPNGEQMQFRINAAPLFGPEGTLERVITAGEDITDLKRHERQLEQRKTELETELSEILGRISDAFYALDEDWQFTHLNNHAAEAFQRTEDELLGRSIWEVFPGDSEERVRDNFQTAMDTQEPVSFELHVEELDAWLEFNVYPSETGLSIYFRDVTERKETQRRLEESNERLEQFAYAASHDLQEPLRMVSSYLQLVENRYGDALDEDGREFIEYAVDGAERMHEMIDGLLRYSRVETQGDPFEPVDLDAVLEDVRENLRMRIEETETTITAESLPRVQGDANQLRQLFQNLLSNAIEYAGDEPPQVRISVERREARSAELRSADHSNEPRGGSTASKETAPPSPSQREDGTAAENDGHEWVVSVSDEGIGIDPDDKERVFEVFQSLHNRDEHSGTGIGLALCKRIVERHGGEIWVDAEPDEGATFSFTLPGAGDRDA